MKLISLFTLTLLISNSYIISMDNQTPKDELSADEKACFAWFDKQQKTLESPFLKLSEQDQEIFETQVQYQEDPEAVKISRQHYAEAFYEIAKNAKIELPYNLDMIKGTLVKMARMMHLKAIEKPTDLLTARMHVFAKLPREEKLTYSRRNYLANPEATQAVVRKWCGQVCEHLIDLKLLEASAKAQREQELFNERMLLFEKIYKNK